LQSLWESTHRQPLLYSRQKRLFGCLCNQEHNRAVGCTASPTHNTRPGQANIKMVKAAELVAASRPGPTENVCPKKLGSKLDVSELNLETNVLKTVRKIG